MNLYRELRIAPSIIGSWDYQLAYTNNLLNDIFGFQRRMYPDHFPYFFRKSLLQELNILYKEAFALNRLHRFREITNIQIPFIHTNYAEIKNVGDVLISTKNNMYFRLTNYRLELKKNFKNLILNKNKTFFYCFNDYSDDKIKKNVIKLFVSQMEKFYPNKLPFEI